MRLDRSLNSALVTGLAMLVVTAPQAVLAQGNAVSAANRAVIDHWTPGRRAAAEPRDLVIDARGQGYLRRADGALEPYGRRVAVEADAPSQRKGPPGGGGGGGSDTTPPDVSNMDPGEGTTIGANRTFSATIIDASGLKSVNFIITYPSGTTQSFSAGSSGGDVWSVGFSGFTDGNWQWHVVAKDNAGKGGNTTTTSKVGFTVDTGGGGSGGGGGGGGSGSGDHVVTNTQWSAGGLVQMTAGRIYFEMPSNQRRKRWSGYVCSGTVATDGTTGRSVIITAAHCVYDDANKSFARRVLFIPDQDGTSGSGTDRNCDNDPVGCWTPSFGVVDVDWTTRTFPDNIPWDYAYYVVNDSGAHSGNGAASDSLDTAVGSLPVDFTAPDHDDSDPSATSPDFTHALGYSYSDDPNFMYCAEDMTTEGADNWWLPSCGLSGGSSGGPWIQPMDAGTGSGPIMSVNSWGYTTSPGMAGPKLSGTTASDLFNCAKTSGFALFGSVADGDAGVIVSGQACMAASP